MKELSYKPCNANTMKIKHAKRKQTLSRLILFVFVLFAGAGLASTDFSKINKGAAIGSGISLATVLPFMVGGKFKELNETELETFLKDATPEDIGKYYSELSNMKKEALDKAIADKASKEDLDKLKEALLEATNMKFEQLLKTSKEQGLAIQKLLEKGQTFEDIKPLRAALKEKLVELKSIAQGLSNDKKEVEVKTLLVRAGVDGNQHAYDLPEIGQMAHRKLSAYDVFPKLPVSGSNDNGTIRYYDWDEDTTVRAAAAVAEGAAFPESTATFKKYSITIEKIGDTLPVTEEFFEDEAAFAGELQMFLMTNVDIKVDSELIDGPGTGNRIKGLKTSVDAFDATDYAGTVADATIYDLLVKIKESITTTGGSRFMPDVALMNISDINKYRLAKDSMKNYIVPPFVSADGKNIDGMLIIECNAMTADTMVVGDRRFGRIYEKAGLTFAKGFVGTQFTEDEMTLKVRKRLAFLIRNCDKGGFKKVTSIAADLAEITAA